MPTKTNAISDRVLRAACAQAKQTGRRVIISCGGVDGLQVRCNPDGKASFVIRYRAKGRQRAVTMRPGKFPAVSLGQARAWARRQLAEATVGVDPWEARREERSSSRRTMQDVVTRYLADKATQHWKPKSRSEFVRKFEKEILPVFGKRDANSITRAEVRRFLDVIAQTRPVTANRTHSLLRMLFKWCARVSQEDLGIVSNPTTDLEKPFERERPRDVTFKDAELRALLGACEGEVLDFLELVVYTAARDLNVRSMKWADIDVERELWEIPAEASKARRKTLIPLSTGSLDVLRRREHTRFLSGYVFPATTKSGHINRIDGRRLKAIERATGLRLRAHDVRRTVSDRVKAEYGEAIMHSLLGHAEGVLTATYGPTPRLKVLFEASEWWFEEVTRIRTGLAVQQ